MKKIIQLQFPKKNNIVKGGDNDKNDDNNHDESIASQINALNEMFLGRKTDDDADADADADLHKTIKRCISKKRLGYKAQDVANEIFDPRWFVTLDEVLELLVASKLKCHYCQTDCAIKYSQPLFDSQWTLDRICNDQGHNRENVVISCLKCNLSRGVRSSRNYKLGKQLKFIKSQLSSYDDGCVVCDDCDDCDKL
jgi:5-methylcytosine-specific restriction endonuclease McrA